MSDALPEIPLRELRFSFSRSSGPGGQNVNRVRTKATLRWGVRSSRGLSEDVRDRFLQRYARRVTSEGEVLITSQRFRDQGRNVADCLEKLRAMLESVAQPRTPRRATRPGRGAKERRLTDKRRRSKVKKSRGRVQDE